MSAKERQKKESKTVETETVDDRASDITLPRRKGGALDQGPGQGLAAPGSAALLIGPTETDHLSTEVGGPGARIEVAATTAASPVTTSKIVRRSELLHNQHRQKSEQDGRIRRLLSF